MALTFRAINSFLLRLRGLENAVSKVFDYVVRDAGALSTALGARFNLNLGHVFDSFRVAFGPRGCGNTTVPERTDRFLDGECVFLHRRTRSYDSARPRRRWPLGRDAHARRET